MTTKDADWFVAVTEFVCPGCGRAIVTFYGLIMSPTICAACLTHPGWTMHPELVHAFDPENERDRAAVTMTKAEIECRETWITATLRWLRYRSRIVEDHRPPQKLEQHWAKKPL
jgi:hypothetical protein